MIKKKTKERKNKHFQEAKKKALSDHRWQAVNVYVLPDSILVALGRNYVAVIGSPEGTAATVVRVSAISASV